MIISRTPFRMSYVGGGTDISAFYIDEPGAVVSTSINKYMYITLHKKFDSNIRVAYSKVEEVDHIKDIIHPLVREALLMLSIDGGVEITSTADIPAKGTGLGSSSSYTVGLLNALYEYKGFKVNKLQLANDACNIEINLCKEPIGKQDQFAASFGGLKMYEFYPDDSVKVHDIKTSKNFKKLMDDSTISFYLGSTRSASNILAKQTKISRQKQKKLVLRRMAEIAREFKNSIEESKMDNLIELMNENWSLKKSMTSEISNNFIDEAYEEGMNAGAKAGKLLGAGGGGFITFFAPPENHKAIRKSLFRLKEVELKMEEGGAGIIFNDNLS
jgi:D-glycero-alpha-D-manno-heptose-7-phosphate kinase